MLSWTLSEIWALSVCGPELASASVAAGAMIAELESLEGGEFVDSLEPVSPGSAETLVISGDWLVSEGAGSTLAGGIFWGSSADVFAEELERAVGESVKD